MLKKTRYVRKPFFVEVVTVDPDNMEEVAKWCGGEVLTEKQGKKTVRYVKVPVHRPMTEKQTKAFDQEKVLKTDTGFKVYTERAFEDCFERADSVEFAINNQDELPFQAPKCGRTDRTVDHKPCVLDADHGKRACTSFLLGPPPPLDALNVSSGVQDGKVVGPPPPRNPNFPKNYPSASSK